MAANELSSTSWGRPRTDVDVRALRRYNRLLNRLAEVGEAGVLALLVAGFIGLVWLLTQTNFENVIFDDGTDARCVYHGDTGEITRVP